MRTLIGFAIMCAFACATWGTYCLGRFVGDASVSSAMSRSLEAIRHDLHERYDATWAVKGVEDGAFVLENPHGTILFRLRSYTLAEDALERIRDGHLACEWFIVPGAMTRIEKDGRAVLIGSAWVDDRNLEHELLRIGALESSATPSADVEGKSTSKPDASP